MPKRFPPADRESVTLRAQEVGRLIRAGLSYSQIGAQLRIDTRTVERYAARLADPTWKPRGEPAACGTFWSWKTGQCRCESCHAAALAYWRSHRRRARAVRDADGMALSSRGAPDSGG